MWRSSTHPDRLRMFSPGLWRQKNPSLHWALPMELLNISDTAAYSVWLSSFVSMSSPQDHCSHCQFLSAIFRHLLQNQLFNTGACWWSPVCAGTCKATFSMWPWLLNTDSRIPPFKQHDILSFISSYQLRVLAQIFWAHFRLMQISEQGLRKTQGKKKKYKELHLAHLCGRYSSFIFVLSLFFFSILSLFSVSNLCNSVLRLLGEKKFAEPVEKN